MTEFETKREKDPKRGGDRLKERHRERKRKKEGG